MPLIDVLMPNPMMPMIAAALDGKVALHKLYEAADPAALLRAVAPGIQAMAVGGGHQPINGSYMAQFPRLRLVSSFGVGYDHIDAVYAGRNGIMVTNTPDVLNDEVADTAMGLLLATVRQLPQAERYLRAGSWPNGNFPLTASLSGKTMGIVGLGRIGKAIAARAQAFGLKIAYHGRSRQAASPFTFYADLTAMAAACDILMVITPGGPQTQHIINAEVLAALGPQGVLINVARGSVVDEAALIAALQAGALGSAGLDVFANEPHVPQALIDMPHVVLLPHVGSATHHTRNAMAQLVIDNILCFAEGRPLLTPVAETPPLRL